MRKKTDEEKQILRKERIARYLKSDARKEEQRKYRASANGKAARKQAAIRYRKNRTKPMPENPEWRRTYNKRWRKNNAGFIVEWTRLRREGLQRSIPNWAEREGIEKLYKMRDNLNVIWNLTGKNRFVVDHVIPLNPRDHSVCGLHCLDNLQLLRITENGSKGDQYTTDW